MRSSVDGRFAFMRSTGDRGTRIVSMETGAELCSLYAFLDESWAVMAPDGRYDGSNGGRVAALHWVVGDEAIESDQLPEYYEPGLLARLVSGETFDAVPPLSGRLFPRLEVKPPDGVDTRLEIEVERRGGGVGRIAVNVNGSELEEDAARLGLVARGTDRAAVEVDLSQAPNLKPGEDNLVEVWAYNEDNTLRSRGRLVHYRPSGTTEGPPPQVWAIVVGSSDYPGDLRLTYPDDDAEAIGEALRIAGIRMLQGDGARVHVTVLSSGSAEASRPTKDNFRNAFEGVIAKAKPQDLLIVYFSGHGATYGGQYYYLTEKARGVADLRVDELRRSRAIGIDELAGYFKRAAANKRALVFDTCSAGRGVEEFGAAMASKDAFHSVERRVLCRLNERTGCFLIAGCADDAQSYESNVYGQGLLTYALLEYMARAGLPFGESVDVEALFSYAEEAVERLSNSAQRPHWRKQPGSKSFPLGRLTPEDRQAIPLREKLPAFLQSQLTQPDFGDELNLNGALDRRLQEFAAREAPALLYHPASTNASGFRLAGGYRVENGLIHATVALRRGGRPVVTREFPPRQAGDKDALAESIVAWAVAQAAARMKNGG